MLIYRNLHGLRRRKLVCKQQCALGLGKGKAHTHTQWHFGREDFKPNVSQRTYSS